LQPLFEPLFHEASFAFRKGRNCHQALELLIQYHRKGFRVVLDADVVGCLDPYSYYTLAVEGCQKVADCSCNMLMSSIL